MKLNRKFTFGLGILLIAVSLTWGACSSAPDTSDEEVAEQQAEQQAEQPVHQFADSDQIPVGDSPILGNPDAPVTIVEFSSMQCPFCGRAAETLDQLLERYPGQVRVVFKHFPLSMQQQARPASIAVEAAHQQGQAFEMKSALFTRLQDYRRYAGQMEELGAEVAEQIGLDVEQFRRDFNDSVLAARVDEDLRLGATLGVRGTPAFFINGEMVSGAQPLNKFAEVVERKLIQIEELEAQGVDRRELYAVAVDHNLAAAEQAAPPAPEPAPERQPTIIGEDDLSIGNSHVKGAEGAPVTIYEFSSFQCPFCARSAETMRQILDEYDGQVRLVYKNFPLAFQEHSEPAARAALAAGEQGKFWEMHQALFEHQREFAQAGRFEELAADLGLDVEQFLADMNSDAIAEQVKSEVAEGRSVGVRGTPAFFINGEMVSGARPIDDFREVIDRHLEK